MARELRPGREKPFPDLFGKGKVYDCILSILIACSIVVFYLAVTSLVSLSFDAALKATSSDGAEAAAKSLSLKNAGIISLIGNTVALSLGILFIYIYRGNARSFLFIKVAPFGVVVPAVILGVSMNLFSDAAIRIIPFSESMISSYREAYSFLGEGNAFIEFLAIAIEAPVVEEVFFRGSVLGALKRGMPTPAAVIVSSVLFGASHGTAISFIFTFILGVILALSLDTTRSMYVPIIIHITFNASSYLISPFLDSTSSTATLLLCIGGAIASAAAVWFIIAYSRLNSKKTTPNPALCGTENGDTAI